MFSAALSLEEIQFAMVLFDLIIEGNADFFFLLVRKKMMKSDTCFLLF